MNSLSQWLRAGFVGSCLCLVSSVAIVAQIPSEDAPGTVLGTSYLAPTEAAPATLESLSSRMLNLEALLTEEAVRQDDEDEGKDERIEALEEKLKKLEGGVVYHSHKNPKMSFFGRIHLDYWAFPDVDEAIHPVELGNPQDRFNFRRLRIGIKGDLTDNMFYKYEGEFAEGREPSYRDAYIGFNDLPILRKVFIGNHKRPYGLDHLNSSRYNVFIERPFIVESFNQDARRLGISSNGVSSDQKYNWRLGVFNQVLTQIGAGYIGDHYQMEVAGRLASTPWYDDSSGGRGYFHWAISGSVGTPQGDGLNNAARYRTRPEARTTARWLDTGRINGADISSLAGFESVLNYGALQIVGEFMAANVDRSGGTGPNLQFHGGYIQAAYFLTGEHMPWDREKGTQARIVPFENFFMVRDCDGCRQKGKGAWQLAARYSYADLTDEDIIGGDAESLTLAMNWYWNPHARLQFNYINGTLDPGRDNLGSGDYDIIGVRAMVDF